VILPKEMAKSIPKTRLLTEDEWRKLGVMQSRGWEHYALHK
jgi:cyclin-dependent kinase regulatory subunit CKS1